MQLDSYLEIFTTMYGWAFANIMGEIVTGTGLVALPFALIIFNGWRDAKENGNAHLGVIGLIESVQIKLIIAMFVLTLCFATTPMTSLLNINLSYTPPATIANGNPGTGSRAGGTGSGYDKAMADASDGSMSSSGSLSYVPAWWFTVMAISSGSNNAIRAGIRNASSDIRMVEDMARTATIEDPQLLSDIQRFYSECFTPARSKYLATPLNQISGTGQAIVSTSNADYGPTDVDWIGSQLFRKEPGYYDTMRSYNPVPGFAIDFSRDTDYIQTPADSGTPEANYQNPQWGRPTCNQWWETASSGLRDRMTMNTSGWQNLLQQTTNSLTWSSPDKAKDSVAQLAQTKANPHFVDSDRIMGNDYDTVTSIGRVVAGGVSTIGVASKTLEASLSMVPLMNGLPMMQALILMGLYMFLPLITFLAGFDLRVMFLGGIAIFTVKFWAVMWTIAQWVDAHLLNAMYPGLQGNIFMQEVTQMASGRVPPGYKRMLLNVLLMLMFVGLPMIWSAMMAWLGIKMGNGLEQMMRSAEKVAADSGSSSGKAVTPKKLR